MDTESLIRDLSRPEAFEPLTGTRPAEVTTDQTHISVVFLAPDEVLKVKKAVKLAFLDFSTLEDRRRFCDCEVELNRPLAPGVYLGVVPVTLDGEGRAQFGGEGEAVDWAVRMNRLPEGRMMHRLLASGDPDAVTGPMLGELARVMAAFHRSAPVCAEAGTPEGVRGMVAGNTGECREHVGLTLSEALFAFLLDYAESTVSEHRDLFARRASGDWVREVHGDLHTQHICFTDPLVVYDCIEFSPGFRRIDVAAEVGFLAMDLDHLGRRDLSQAWLDQYAREIGEPIPDEVLDYYLNYRACVRGKVLSIKAGDRECPEADRAAAERDAADYFALAAGYALRRGGPRLAVACGPIASGKSTGAGWIADRLGFEWLRSDLERKRMLGLGPTERLPEAEQETLYNEEMDRRTYDFLRDRALEALREGRSVVLDATYRSREDRDRVRRMAEEAGAACRFLFFDAPEEVLAERLKAREGRRGEVSDARADLLPRHLAGFEFPDAGEPDVARLDASGDRRALFSSLLDALIAGA